MGSKVLKVNNGKWLVLIFIGVLLAFWEIICQLHGPLPVQIRKNVITHKNDIKLIDAKEALSRLNELPNRYNSSYLISVNANKIFSQSIIHYWPEKNESDKQIEVQITENWIRYLFFNFLKILSKYDLVDSSNYLERLNYEDVVNVGAGLCSQVSIGLSDYLNSLEIPSKIASLGGHVVVTVDTEKGPLVLDPDFNVYINKNLKDIENNTRLIESAYRSFGYNETIINKLKLIYSEESNLELNIKQLYPKRYFYYLTTNVLSWFIPLFFIVFSSYKIIYLSRYEKK